MSWLCIARLGSEDTKNNNSKPSAIAREVLISRAESNRATTHCQEWSIMMDVPSHTTMHQLMALAEDKSGWLKLIHAIHSPKSRKSSYTRRATESLWTTELLDMDAEEWYKGAQIAKTAISWVSRYTKTKAKRASNAQILISMPKCIYFPLIWD